MKYNIKETKKIKFCCPKDTKPVTLKTDLFFLIFQTDTYDSNKYKKNGQIYKCYLRSTEHTDQRKIKSLGDQIINSNKTWTKTENN